MKWWKSVGRWYDKEWEMPTYLRIIKEFDALILAHNQKMN